MPSKRFGSVQKGTRQQIILGRITSSIVRVPGDQRSFAWLEHLRTIAPAYIYIYIYI